ncbi:glycosyltransferase family 39 protein [Labedaea rhizosphaerae]|uniref:4-amino-4-deoxy-L-arabinose transferase-like glycosyltransferase n=1 Tax=Labedaea rhizosphaerae TaxID=598644 RepID=A0A4R6SC23_LABRH|nr:glycosyltransferase family 39 protein [Labedaea rhizosphaerae]TDP96576.1 4-amino-4-deoxy-L-arabinose transferase-like glycosyltransferase [Labedaea rhizosphaerae]
MTAATLDRTDQTAPAATPPERGQPRWVRPSVFALLLGAAVLYLWDLSASGYGNEFYAAATQAGSQNWTAWLFGALDSGSGGAITVDKPPAFLWVSGLAARIFGFSSWTVLAPQAIEGVAAVGMLYLTVRRTSGYAAGLLSATALALTPVAVLMFRFNLPDPLLVLLMICGAYAVVRATEKASARWLVLAGVFLGFAFLTKMLQGFLVLPAFVLVYLLAAPTTIGRRLAHVGAAALALVVSAGWFVALVELWPAASRPYIGGSTDNSLLELALGYNGFGRLSGGDGNPGGGGNAGFGGSSGLTRLFGASFGTEISWLLPAALIALVAGLWFTRTAPRTDKTRAALLLWGGWLFVTGLVFSLMNGITHPYYSVALAPAIAALVGIGGRELWRGRDHTPARAALAAMVTVTGVWGFVLLHRTADWLPALRWVVLVAAILVATAIAVGVHQFRRAATVLAAAAILVTGLGAGAYGVATAAVAHQGSIPTSGPVTNDFGRGPGGGGPGDRTGDSALTSLLANTTTTWAAATEGAQQAASLELASGKAVIGIGGFGGSDPAPTLAQFQQWVHEGKVRYYVTGGMGGMGGRGSGGGIAEWVAANYQATTVGGATVYDLTS